jgi:hypothetical protein
MYLTRGEIMEWKTDSVTVSVKDRGNYIQITKSGIFDSKCKISFRPEQIDILNQWLKEAKNEALELRETYEYGLRRGVSMMLNGVLNLIYKSAFVTNLEYTLKSFSYPKHRYSPQN